MEKSMVNLNISEEIVRPIIEKQVQAAVLANIGNPEEVISKTVSLALKQKVDSSGNISKYESDNRYDFLELMTKQAIRDAAKEALAGWLEENKKLIKEMVIKEMNKPERQKSFVGAFADAVEKSLECRWAFRCDINFDNRDA